MPNPSTALNTIIKSLDINPGDEILSSNHEYETLDRTWKYISKKTGSKYIQVPISLPLESENDFIDIERNWKLEYDYEETKKFPKPVFITCKNT